MIGSDEAESLSRLARVLDDSSTVSVLSRLQRLSLPGTSYVSAGLDRVQTVVHNSRLWQWVSSEPDVLVVDVDGAFGLRLLARVGQTVNDSLDHHWTESLVASLSTTALGRLSRSSVDQCLTALFVPSITRPSNDVSDESGGSDCTAESESSGK